MVQLMNYKLGKARTVPVVINKEGFMDKSELELFVIKYV